MAVVCRQTDFILWVVPKQLSSKSFVHNIMLLFFFFLLVDLFPHSASGIFAKISSFIEKYQFPNTRMHFVMQHKNLLHCLCSWRMVVYSSIDIP